MLGLDCEWTSSAGGSRRPVSLLQLATLDGLCVLVRLCHIPDLPDDLRVSHEPSTAYAARSEANELTGYYRAPHPTGKSGSIRLPVD